MRGSSERHQGAVPLWLEALLIGGAFGALLWLEWRRPLRRGMESKSRRVARNLAVAAISATTVQLAERPVTTPLARLVERRRWGLLGRTRLPVWLEVALAAALLDYTVYLWHILVHRVPWLWRFHQVHHVDLDMDASTALRFHFGELMISVVWRAGQIVAIGVSPLSLSVWQTATLVSILFHHSNVEIPARVERRLALLVMTPRLHAIHHSVVETETSSNWSSGLTIWDRLHRTLRPAIVEDGVTIGVPAYREPTELTLPRILEMPFEAQRPSWRLPDGDSADQCFRRP